MKTLFTVKTLMELPNGLAAISGSVEGEFLSRIGSQGRATTPGGNLRVEILGIGVVDPSFLTKERQGILIKIVEGNVGLLAGATLHFECKEYVIDRVDFSSVTVLERLERGEFPLCPLCRSPIHIAQTPEQAKVLGIPPGMQCSRNAGHFQVEFNLHRKP
jgi:hypothetical protein